VNKRAAFLRGKSRIVSPFVETADNFYLFIYLFCYLLFFLLSNIITLPKQTLAKAKNNFQTILVAPQR